MYHILLDSSIFPSYFKDLNLSGYTDAQKQAFAEKELVAKIKKNNSKIDNIDVVYCDISSMFPDALTTKSSGLIVEEITVGNDLANLLQTQQCFIKNVLSSTEQLVYRIKFYVFFSICGEDTRSAFISQKLFPDLIDLSNKIIKTSTYNLTNHPVIFVNMVNKTITAEGILRELSTAICSLNMRYIELFNTNTFTANNSFYNVDSLFTKYYKNSTNIYDTHDFILDFNEKTLKLKTGKLYPPAPGDKSYVKLKASGTDYEFNGSSEKFYWSHCLFLAIICARNGFNVDYSDLESYLKINTAKFNNSDKITRFNYFLQYIKKICEV